MPNGHFAEPQDKNQDLYQGFVRDTSLWHKKSGSQRNCDPNEGKTSGVLIVDKMPESYAEHCATFLFVIKSH
jgi:hypothetical protein